MAVVWAVAAVVLLGIGFPAAAWWYMRRQLPVAATTRFRGYDEIDRWLADRFYLGWQDRSLVRAAVSRGQTLASPGLDAAARGLAEQFLADQFRALRLSRRLGWVQLASAGLYAVLGIVLFTRRGLSAGLDAVAGIALINAGLFAYVGSVRALRTPRLVRRNAERVLQRL